MPLLILSLTFDHYAALMQMRTRIISVCHVGVKTPQVIWEVEVQSKKTQ